MGEEVGWGGGPNPQATEPLAVRPAPRRRGARPPVLGGGRPPDDFPQRRGEDANILGAATSTRSSGLPPPEKTQHLEEHRSRIEAGFSSVWGLTPSTLQPRHAPLPRQATGWV